MKPTVILAAAVLAGACSSSSTQATKPSSSPTTPARTASTPSAAPSTSAGAAPCPTAGSTPSGAASGDVLVPGDIPDNQAYISYTSPTDGYRLQVPEGWARAQAGGIVTFTDKFNSIRVEVVPLPSAPSVASVQSQDLPALARSVPCLDGAKVTQTSRRAGPAVLVTYRARSTADPVTGKSIRQDVERYAFWHAGKEALITLSTPQGSDNVDPWRRVTDSFVWAG
jgi:hypothetical protein